MDKIETIMMGLSEDTTENTLSKRINRCSYNSSLLNKIIDEEECTCQSSLNGEEISKDDTFIAKN